MIPNDFAAIWHEDIGATPVATAKEVRELAIDYRNLDGEILYLGGSSRFVPTSFHVRWKALGAGLYEVYLEEKQCKHST